MVVCGHSPLLIVGALAEWHLVAHQLRNVQSIHHALQQQQQHSSSTHGKEQELRVLLWWQRWQWHL